MMQTASTSSSRSSASSVMRMPVALICGASTCSNWWRSQNSAQTSLFSAAREDGLPLAPPGQDQL